MRLPLDPKQTLLLKVNLCSNFRTVRLFRGFILPENVLCANVCLLYHRFGILRIIKGERQFLTGKGTVSMTIIYIRTSSGLLIQKASH